MRKASSLAYCVRLVFIVWVIIPVVGHGGIIEDVDSFRETKFICSRVVGSDIPQYGGLGGFLAVSLCYGPMHLDGVPSSNEREFLLHLIRPQGEVRLATSIEMKMEGRLISDEGLDAWGNPSKCFWYQESIDKRGGFVVPLCLVRLIRTAKKVVIRVNYHEQSPVTWEVPEALLEEWKTLMRSSPYYQ